MELLAWKTAVGVDGWGAEMMDYGPLKRVERRVYNKWRWLRDEHQK